MMTFSRQSDLRTGYIYRFTTLYVGHVNCSSPAPTRYDSIRLKNRIAEMNFKIQGSHRASLREKNPFCCPSSDSLNPVLLNSTSPSICTSIVLRLDPRLPPSTPPRVNQHTSKRCRQVHQSFPPSPHNVQR